MLELSAEITVDRPAALVWATVADYGRDPQWRAGVTTMDPTPSGPVRAVSAERCRVRIDQRIHPRGAQRLMTPLLRVVLSRTLAADARRLKALVESRSPTGVRGR